MTLFKPKALSCALAMVFSAAQVQAALVLNEGFDSLPGRGREL